ncbi:MAG: Ldh family oxidoreductase, partial [archaeon GB-1867-035]|nr:Ldh family oxidoreductase [Candidatus Culexmicrobium profundum]
MVELDFYEREPPIPSEDYFGVSFFDLRAYVYDILRGVGVSSEDSRIVADVLVLADLFGISSHGVQRTWRYVEGVKRGNVNINPDIRVIRDFGATALIDGDNGFGQVVGVKAMRLAIEKAKRFGISMVLVRNSNHFGIAGYYSLMAVFEGLIGVTATNSSRLVAYVNT